MIGVRFSDISDSGVRLYGDDLSYEVMDCCARLSTFSQILDNPV